MVIPEILVKQISRGKVVLFLGAGASLSATDEQGNHPPDGPGLAKMIADEFLDGKYADHSLSEVADYAISQTNVFSVQDFIRSVFEPYNPSDGHLMLTTFRWHGIATTNYDRILEKAYETNCERSVQKPMPFIENGDRVEDKLRAPKDMPYLKLHGCITRIAKNHPRLILSTDQNVQYSNGRTNLFIQFEEWAHNYTFVFIGTSLQDHDIRYYLLRLAALGDERPRSYLVTQDPDRIKANYWAERKIEVLDGTFESFSESLDVSIESPFRVAVPSIVADHAIHEFFASPGQELSPRVISALDLDFDYVPTVTSDEIVDPMDFYKGHNPGWSAIEQNLDVARGLAERILEEHVLPESEEIDGWRFILIKGFAGSGKSVVLHRIAWDAAKGLDRLCIFLRQGARLDPTVIHELLDATNVRLYLFIDNVADRVHEIDALAGTISLDNSKLTIIASDRHNEWNYAGDRIGDLVTSEYELKNLSETEIRRLLGLLETHKSLGVLQDLSDEERFEAFKEYAGRQLLVALHEATLGRPLEDIIADEFRNVTPPEAQLIYLTICALNRLRIPVRAGVISRIHGIPFEQFQMRFFKPLEHIVYTGYDKLSRDHIYTSRHPHVADIVFERILDDPEQRFSVYQKCLTALNTDYYADRKAFREMIRSRNLMRLFPNHEHITAIFRVAEQVSPDDPGVLHQEGVYEMNRAAGNLSIAARLLGKAARLSSSDTAIRHSMAELELKRSERATSSLEKEGYIKAAADGAMKIVQGEPLSAHGYHTLIKALVQRVILYIKDDPFVPDVFEKFVSQTERFLTRGLQQFPGNSHLLEAEAQLATVLSDSDRAIKALEKAFESNPRSGFIATRLSHHYSAVGNVERAKGILQSAINASPGDRLVRFSYARLLLDYDGNKEEIEYHLGRSFTRGDKNYFAKLLYGRQLFENGKADECHAFFRALRGERYPRDLRAVLQRPIEGYFTGEITHLGPYYAFVARDGMRDSIYMNQRHINDTVWHQMAVGVRVSFRIAFTIGGANAFEVSIVS